MKNKLVFLFLLVSSFACAQEEKIGWLTLSEAEKKCGESSRPYLIDFYLPGDASCERMQQITYVDPVVISFVNHYFYPVRINAESADTLFFRGKIYPPLKKNGRTVCGLMSELLKGQPVYPATAFLYDKEHIDLVVPGFLEVAKMEAFLIYFAENVYSTTPVPVFVNDFEQAFHRTMASASERKAGFPWVPFGQLENLRKNKSKKILLYLTAPWNNSAKIMEKVVFNDSVFSALAGKYFYCLRLDVQSQDTIPFLKHRFINAGKENNHLHQLAIALSDKIIRVPSIYIFDEQGKLMEHLYFYLDRERGAMVLDFLGSDQYKSMSWGDFVEVKSREVFWNI